MADWLEFMIGEAFQGIRRNALMTFAAVSTIAIALFLIGGFGYGYFQAYRYVEDLPNRLDVRVYIKDGLSSEMRGRLEAVVKSEPGIATSKFISKDEAWAAMLKSHPDIPPEIDNPLPDAYNLTFLSVEQADAAAAALDKTSGVDKVLYMKDLAQSLKQAFSIIRTVGYCGLLLLAIGGVITFNSIQLAMVARRREIRIMQLVGASISTIRVPFVLEGLVEGILGGCVGAAGLGLASTGINRYIASFGREMPPFPWLAVGGLVVLGGAMIGFFCSSMAAKMAVRV
jgi:cell division transport system permease protein